MPKRQGNGVAWGLGGFLLGGSVAFLFTWLTVIRPLESSLVAREKALQHWDELNRQERENIAAVKNISVQELRTWVATIENQNARFGELQRRMHQQELELSGPGTTYILIAAVVFLGVLGAIVLLVRDRNAAAATTLENVANLAPEEMVRSVLVSVITRAPEALPPRGQATSLPERGTEQPGHQIH